MSENKGVAWDIDIAWYSQELAEVEQLCSKLAAAENQLEAGYAKLAFLLKEVSENRYWHGTYKNFGDFLGSLQQKFNLGKSQMYNYLSTAKELQDQLTEDELNTMGISKALVLRDVRATSGKNVPQDVVDRALDPKVTVKDLKKLLYDAGKLTQPEEGIWYDLDFSGYYTEDEIATLRDAANAARHTDPPIPEKTAEHVQRKSIAYRWAQSFLAEYAGDVIDGGRSL